MNNTKKTLAIVAVLMAATLVVGTFATMTTTTQSTYAYAKKLPRQDDKKTRDNGSGNGNGNTVIALKCQNKGSASGFDTAVDQECENLICTHPGNNATCSQEGVVTPTTTTTKTPPTVPLNCEQCIRKFLNDDQIALLLSIHNKGTLGEVCDMLHTGTQQNIQDLFLGISGSHSIAVQIIQCLLDAGIVFSPPGG